MTNKKQLKLTLFAKLTHWSELVIKQRHIGLLQHRFITATAATDCFCSTLGSSALCASSATRGLTQTERKRRSSDCSRRKDGGSKMPKLSDMGLNKKPPGSYRLEDDSPMPFGKYRGERMDAVPAD